uniref:Putative secreted protein n=1 Tax=Anopheles darlingi TaxID=43151 RepID=A0A2M4DPY5_ANODA
MRNCGHFSRIFSLRFMRLCEAVAVTTAAAVCVVAAPYEVTYCNLEATKSTSRRRCQSQNTIQAGLSL